MVAEQLPAGCTGGCVRAARIVSRGACTGGSLALCISSTLPPGQEADSDQCAPAHGRPHGSCAVQAAAVAPSPPADLGAQACSLLPVWERPGEASAP